jgi:hypothetical protein
LSQEDDAGSKIRGMEVRVGYSINSNNIRKR